MVLLNKFIFSSENTQFSQEIGQFAK